MGEDTKECPICGAEIKSVAKKCRYCGNWLDASTLKNVKTAGQLKPKSQSGINSKIDQKREPSKPIEYEPATVKNSLAKTIMLILLGALGLLVIILVIIFTNNDSDKNNAFNNSQYETQYVPADTYYQEVYIEEEYWD